MLNPTPIRPCASLPAIRRADRCFRTNQGSAFSLIELTVVIAVLSIAAAISIPRYASAVNHFNGDAAARRIASDFAMTAALARSTGKTQSVIFVKNADTYSIPNAVRLDHKSSTYSVDLAGTYAAKITSVSFASTSSADFDAYGSCNGGTMTIQVGTYIKTITLDATNGTVTVQ